MKRRLVVRPEAETDIAEAADWYELQRAGLGARFLSAVEACVSAVELTPFGHPRVHGEARRAALSRFPYGLIYSASDQEILILACWHARRDPGIWQRRAEKR